MIDVAYRAIKNLDDDTPIADDDKHSGILWLVATVPSFQAYTTTKTKTQTLYVNGVATGTKTWTETSRSVVQKLTHQYNTLPLKFSIMGDSAIPEGATIDSIDITMDEAKIFPSKNLGIQLAVVTAPAATEWNGPATTTTTESSHAAGAPANDIRVVTSVSAGNTFYTQPWAGASESTPGAGSRPSYWKKAGTMGAKKFFLRWFKGSSYDTEVEVDGSGITGNTLSFTQVSDTATSYNSGAIAQYLKALQPNSSEEEPKKQNMALVVYSSDTSAST